MGLEEIKQLIAEGKVEEANAAMDKFEAENKAVFEEQKETRIENKSLEAKKSEEVLNLTKVEEVKDVVASSEVEVFAKILMGRELTVQDKAKYEDVYNAAYTHQVSNQPLLIPETVMRGILEQVEKEHPFYGEIAKLNVTGNFTIKQHTGVKAGHASFVDEGTPATDTENEYAEITLTGFEIAKLVRISWKLEAMSIEEFVPHIQNLIATEIGDTLGYVIFNGTGVKQPKGVLKVLSEQAGTPQVVTATGSIGYADITNLRSKVASKFANGAKFYAKSTTVWNDLATVVDGNGRPVFIREIVDGGVGTIFGIPVVEDDGVPEGEVVLGNPSAGVIQNTNVPFSIQTERSVVNRENIYQGYALLDWAVTYTQAFAHLKVTAGE